MRKIKSGRKIKVLKVSGRKEAMTHPESAPFFSYKGNSKVKTRKVRTGRTRFNIGDDVKFKGKRTYVKNVLGVGKPVLYELPKNKIATASQLKRIK